jgi:4-hydroxythreonine-4-phosphate dehydrogenase
MGDPAGIGPEIILKALRRPHLHSLCRPCVFGSARFLKNLQLDPVIDMDYLPIENPSDAVPKKGTVSIVEVNAAGRIRPGKRSAASGSAALSYLDRAIESARRGEIDAIVTAPVSKAAIRQAGLGSFVGHTEYLAEQAGNPEVAMMFHGARLNVVLVTTHLPLKDVADSITIPRILSVIKLANETLKRLGFSRRRIGVAGLNPHAGEEKSFGNEDADIIAPAVRAARKGGVDARGPFPADTLFHAAYNGEYDLVVAMYHDQALAPFKMIAFDTGVNITLGLPFVRTSVDHGTAFNIAGKGVASEKSMIAAIKLAGKLASK